MMVEPMRDACLPIRIVVQVFELFCVTSKNYICPYLTLCCQQFQAQNTLKIKFLKTKHNVCGLVRKRLI